MITNIQKWGNSQGIRIPKSILDDVNFSDNERVMMYVEDSKIIIKKADERKNINQLFEDFDEEYKPVSIDWGKPVGDEIW